MNTTPQETESNITLSQVDESQSVPVQQQESDSELQAPLESSTSSLDSKAIKRKKGSSKDAPPKESKKRVKKSDSSTPSEQSGISPDPPQKKKHAKKSSSTSIPQETISAPLLPTLATPTVQSDERVEDEEEEEEDIYKRFMRGRDRIVKNLSFEQKLYILCKQMKHHPELSDCFQKTVPPYHSLYYDSSDETEEKYETKIVLPRVGKVKSFVNMTVHGRIVKNPPQFCAMLFKSLTNHIGILSLFFKTPFSSVVPNEDEHVSLEMESESISSSQIQVPWSSSCEGRGKGIYYATAQHMYMMERLLNSLSIYDILLYISKDIDNMNTYTNGNILTTHFYGKTEDHSEWVFDSNPLAEIEVSLPPSAEFPSFLKRLRGMYSVEIENLKLFHEKLATLFKDGALMFASN